MNPAVGQLADCSSATAGTAGMAAAAMVPAAGHPATRAMRNAGHCLPGLAIALPLLVPIWVQSGQLGQAGDIPLKGLLPLKGDRRSPSRAEAAERSGATGAG